MAELVRTFDWAATPLGPSSTWPSALCTTLGLVLSSPYPMWFVWGEARTFFYNDAFRPLIGSKPEPLGKPFAEASAEALSTLGPILERAFAGEATSYEDFPITLERHGYPEATWWNFAYSPIPGDTGEVDGALCVSHETTSQVKARAALTAERESLARLFEQAPSFISVLSGPKHIYELVNAAHQRLTSGRTVLGKSAREVLPELEGQGIFELFDEVYESGCPRVLTAYRLYLADAAGTIRERYFDSICQPIVGEDGAVTGIFVEGHDVTDRVAGEATLREREERLRLAIDAGRMATWDYDVAPRLVTLSAGAQAMMGLPVDAPLPLAELEARILPGEFDRIRAAFREAQARNDPFFESEFRHRRDGQVRWFLIRGRIGVVPATGTQHCFGVLMDLTERKEAEERLMLLAREVDHRANNLLAAVQSVVNLTRADDVPGFRQRIRGRIRALANAHRLLAASRWTGAGLGQIVAEELEPYSEGHVRIEGPDARLAPPVAQALAMALHELATNAAKHGSLSTPEGRTLVTWSAPDAERLIHLTWREEGGPTPETPPRPGFGMTLLQRAFAGQTGGGVELDWRPEGLVCRLSFAAL